MQEADRQVVWCGRALGNDAFTIQGQNQVSESPTYIDVDRIHLVNGTHDSNLPCAV